MNFSAELIQQLHSAQHIAVFTGAGVSAESGIPTFREAQTGLWARFRAEDLATPEAFRRDPQTVWRWYEWRRDLMRGARPNPAHHAVAALEQCVARVSVITQNVDGLHSKAGSAAVSELHGNIWNNHCLECGRPAGVDVPCPDVPHCLHCGGLVRPGVVWFGEALPVAVWSNAMSTSMAADMLLCIGTSSMVEPAASLPHAAAAEGACVVQINPERTAHDNIARFVLRGSAGIVLPALLRAAWPAQ